MNTRTNYIQQTSFGVQQQFGDAIVLSANHVGNWGRKMNRVQNANQGFIKSCPTCAVVTSTANIYFPLTASTPAITSMPTTLPTGRANMRP